MENQYTIRITYKEGMTMPELVNEINEYNDAVSFGFKAMMQQQSNLLLGEIKAIKSDIVDIKSDIKTIKSDIVGVKGEIKTIKSDIVDIKGNTKSINEKLDKLIESDVKDINEKLDKLLNNLKG